ncbi:hypothetical protein RSK20926_07392 [Roseobacter sp. SK209-2-6]|uniref:DUF6478 family protein n=1 Tax=Roseobacter sp. SK209-2-6 TaxID=388739 RepID=UPI0000F3D880|nr:DUF6478 family protein [Roseobacter sp. SK209-2-6]EBA17543.1 hypothetical protein RSK20926_07392 [Roseobacter sp. SK209-2-6]
MAAFFEKLNYRNALRRWRRAAAQAETAPLAGLREQRTQAKELRSALDRLIHVADGRLALPQIGSSFFPRPHGTDWSWRPELWRGPLPSPGIASAPSKSTLGEEITLFHDCTTSELTLRQLRNSREEDLAPFGLRMDVFNFDGSFLSLVVDLPVEACKGLTKQNLIRIDTIIETEKPLEIFARLNVRHGPNTDQLVRELPAGLRQATIEYDMAYSNLNEKRIEKIWLDLIFEGPVMNQVTIRDLTFARHRRANI